jgi:3-phenylpropionate/trans-cinnamate dioxygenase ferredoxin reductase subunit
VKEFDVLVVGAGHAGIAVTSQLAQNGYMGSVGLVSDHDHLPYEKPPLSKTWLQDGSSIESIAFRSADYWATSKVELLQQQRVEVIDARQSLVGTATGQQYRYDKLVWAAGGQARRHALLRPSRPNVHYLSSVDDALRLRSRIGEARVIAIIGGGFIGLEVGAGLRQLGMEVDVVEKEERLLSRVSGETVSAYFRGLHLSKGVRVHTGVSVTDLDESQGGAVVGLHLSNGTRVRCDLVLVGIGQDPNVSPLAAAGAAIADGVVVDGNLQTSLPNVFAIGDCANFPREMGQARVRLQSVQNAVAHGTRLANGLSGRDRPRMQAPTFWSHQFDAGYKSAGLIAGHDDEIILGNVDHDKFSVLYLRDGILIAAECVNRVADFARARRAIGSPVAAMRYAD